MPAPVAWLLSAYRSDSHAYWADWLCSSFDDYRWHQRELPGRHFRWRIRGNPLSWLDALPPQQPDFIVATSMVDLATLRGLHPRLARTPCLYYFHENQFAYPVGEQQVKSVEPQMVQLYGALAADVCLFNSAFNMDSFLHGIDELLMKMPDHAPGDVSRRLHARCSVLPVPVSPIPAAQKQPLILWNHRWEYDKAPGVFADAVIELAARRDDFRLALLGPRGRAGHPALARLREQLPGLIAHDGRVDAARYRDIVARTRVVVSSAIHEFQGLAVMQAVSAGAIPVVPDDLCYREQYAERFRYPPGDAAVLATRLDEALDADVTAAPDIHAWTDQALEPLWHEQLAAMQRVSRAGS